MGIEGFNKFVKEHYSRSVKKKWLKHYDNMYIDLNYCLLNISHVSNSKTELINKLETLLMNFIVNVNPTKRLILAADGPAPLAKLFLQRKRRLENSKKITNINTSSLNFTPGTDFMNNLENYLFYFINKIKFIYNIEVITLMNDYNEAEIKIKKKVNDIVNKFPEDTHCIVSNDADIIVLLLNHLKLIR